jgi:hypothetical protein
MNKLFSALIENPGLPDPSTDNTIETVLSFVFGLLAVICVIVIIIAGIQFVISGGEPQKVAKARQAILYAVIGLIVAVFSTVIVGFIAGRLT